MTKTLKRSCLMKHTYSTIVEAEAQIRKQYGAPAHMDKKGLLKVYMCKFCPNYHIGHRNFQ